MNPVIVGGQGGSGTTAVASCLFELGYHLGRDLNLTLDNRSFWKIIETVKRKGVYTITDEYLARCFKAFVNIEGMHSIKRYGWKEPNSHIILDRLMKYFPNMKYVFVVRNGLDMAYSNNKRQFKLWRNLVNTPRGATPQNLLQFWCSITKRTLSLGEELGDRFLVVKYDELCNNTNTEMNRLCDFLGVEFHENLMTIMNPDNTVGRFREHVDVFRPVDIDYVKELGFDVA